MDSPQPVRSAEVATPAQPAAVPTADETRERRTLGLILLAALATFWPTLASFPGTWNASYQEHGFFVGGLVLWLIWRDRRRVLRVAGRGIPDLLPVVGLLSLAWLFAVIMNLRLVHQLVFATIVATAALGIFGWEARRPILVTAATLLLAIPFWGALAPFLQRMTTVASGGMTTLAGIEAEIGYDYISISSGTFLVEEGCSGINYLMGGLVLGAFYAHLFADRWQTKAKIVAVAGAMAIVGNWIRVAVLIFLGEATAMQSPYIEDHLWQGWAIFTLLMIPTYFLARRIEEREAARFRATEAGPDAADADRAGSETERGDGRAAVPAPLPTLRRRALRTGAVAVVGPILFLVLGSVPRGDDVDLDAAVFTVAEGWSIAPLAAEVADTWVPDYRGYDQRALWSVTGPERTVHAARYYFLDQRQGEELIQFDNRIAADSLVAADRIIGPLGPERRLVHEAIVRDSEAPRVAWYWYRVAGFDTPFEIKAKLLEILAFFRRSPAAELVVLHAECEPDDCTDAAMALRAAMGVPAAAGQAGS